MPDGKPNIVVMYADDLGFGDIGCYGADTIPTPNLDRLASRGVRFTQAYATAATCTPSRFSLLTGSYPWRNPRAAILPGDAPLIIDPDTPTVPSVLKQAGYRTAVVGKWHLGLGRGNIDWNDRIDATPLDIGFDHSFIMAATNDRVPCVYVDGRCVRDLDPDDPITVVYDPDAPPLEGELPEGRHHPELLKMKYSHGHDNSIVNGVSRIGRMAGGASALWDDETMGEVFLEEAKKFVADNAEGPFFLYYAFHQPHVPRIPSKRFRGATKHGPRGDVIAEMDWCVGQFLDFLKQQGLAEDTLVIFTSDNGPVLDDGYHDQAEELNGDHRITGPLRGSKYSLYDGGTRVPTIASWPGRVPEGVESDAVLCQMDFLASFAALVGVELPANAGPDSFDHLSGWLGEDAAGREELVVEGTTRKTVLRQGDWTMIPPYDGPFIHPNTKVELGNMDEPQLYDLSQDIGQIRNLAAEQPDRVEKMQARLDAIIDADSTRPGYSRT
ncbi:MAG: sulfatase family protein [Phycisphaerae bacterium]